MRTLLPIFMLIFINAALAGEKSLFNCRKIKDIEERVACYDSIVDSMFPLAETTSASSREPEVTVNNTALPGSLPRTSPSSENLFGKSTVESKKIVEESLEIEGISQLEAIVTSVTKNTYRKLTISLDNGQVWRQLDSEPLPLKEGEAIIIRSARLGSYLLEKASGSGSIRVNRLD
jgi:hypothetical protein